MGQQRIPRKDELFDTFLNISADYLKLVDAGSGIPNWKRLNLRKAEAIGRPAFVGQAEKSHWVLKRWIYLGL